MNSTDSPQLLRVSEAAERLRVTPHTFYRFIREQGLPVVKITRGSYRIDPDDLDAWLEDRASRTDQ